MSLKRFEKEDTIEFGFEDEFWRFEQENLIEILGLQTSFELPEIW